MVDKKLSLLDAFKVADSVLSQGVQGISDIISVPGLINVDFADVKTIMSNSGSALMGVGTGVGENRAQTAARMAIASPLLEISMEGARGLLLNITGGADLTMSEVDEAAKIVAQAADPDANIIFGATIDDKMRDQIKITVIATGFDQARQTLKEFISSSSSVRADEKQDTTEDKQDKDKHKAHDIYQKDDNEEVWDIPAFLRQRN